MENNTAQIKPPEVLYQYRPPTEWALGNLSRCVLHFGAPANFNDPYDCGIVPRIVGYTEDDYQNLARRGIYLSAPLKMSKEMQEQLNALYTKEWNELRGLMRVACFSERNDSLLMWSHYSGGGKGFCVAFNTQKSAWFKSPLIRKVKYLEKIPEEDSSTFKDGGLQMFDFWAHKPKDWEYEQEWRLFNATNYKDGKEHKKGYNSAALKAIYFGTEAEEETKARIRAIVEEKYPHAELWQGRLSNTEYKVEFDRIR